MKKLLLPLLLAACSLLPAAPAVRPNILFIAVDDLRDWVGYMEQNPQSRTPNFDRLSQRGVSFTRSYCAAPVCNPSRAALMSGLRPSTSGCYDNGQNWQKLIPSGRGLTAAFKQAGYLVKGAGKIYHSDTYWPAEWDDYFDRAHGYSKSGEEGAPEQKIGKLEGFQEPLQHDLKDQDLPDWRITDYCIAELAKPHDQPLFLACGWHKPHLPWAVPRKYYDRFPIESIKLPPYLKDDLLDVPAQGIKFAKPGGDHAAILRSGRWQEAIRSYLACIAYVDMNLGRLLDALDRSPARDRTIICLWGDHGWHLGEKDHWRKFALWEVTTRAPLIWVVPGVTKGGTRSDRPVDFMSIYPTLCELAGIPRPAHVEGVSIRALLANPQAEWSTPALTTYRLQNHSLRTAQWRYIRYHDGGEELYDHNADPNEWTNLASKPEHTALKQALAKNFPVINAPDLKGTGADESGAAGTPNPPNEAKKRAKKKAE